MAPEPESQSFNDRYAERLSAGTYTWKKLRETAITTAGLVGGWFAGKGVEKLAKGEAKIIYNLPLFGRNVKASMGAIIGAISGSIISGFVLGYEHWRKEESSKLGIDEINNDVANIKIRQHTDPELVKENDRLRAMLEETTSHAEKIGKPAANYTEKAQNASATSERGI